MSPPIKVTVISGSPLCMTNPAAKVLKGRLCGSMTFGLFGFSVNRAPRLCRMKPYPGTVIPEPNAEKLLLTQDTMFPSLSAVESTMVPPGREKSPAAPGVDACRASTLPHNDAACASDSSLASGTAENFGSALYRYRSPYASFFASTKKCQYCGLDGPSEANVAPAAHCGTQACRILSISLAAHACDGGGNSRMSKPWYSVCAGSTH